MYVTDSTEKYTDTLRYVLQDGKLNQGEQQVLETFTRDVCNYHLPIATAVWNEYSTTLVQ